MVADAAAGRLATLKIRADFLRVAASRRKAVTLRFAKIAAERLALALELSSEPRKPFGAIPE